MRPQPALAPRIETRADAEALVAELGMLLDKLSALVVEETRLVRSAKVRAATALAETKADLARRYATAFEKLKANNGIVGRYAPAAIADLRRRNASFQAELQVNMAVLSTMRAVSEELVRGVAGDVAQKSAPKTYAYSGTMAPPSRSSATPVTLSRVL